LPQLDSLVNALRAGGINAEGSNNIRREVWSKLWGNMTLNALSALTRRGTSTMRQTPMYANFVFG
jgi:2-dehydropantoate 2-reductase